MRLRETFYEGVNKIGYYKLFCKFTELSLKVLLLLLLLD